MEPVVAKSPFRHAGVVRGLDRAAERARVPKTGVVDEDEQHVRGALWWPRMTDQAQSGCDPASVWRTMPEKAGRRIGRWLRLTSFMVVVLVSAIGR